MLKLQSAMEYLMTYGWSILLIAIVLAALFSLGIFNSLGPRAPTNSCRVFRPNGPGSTSNLNLQGVCTGLKPQYVAKFDGALSNVNVPISSSLNIANTITISMWYKLSSASSSSDQLQMNLNGACNGYTIYFRGSSSDPEIIKQCGGSSGVASALQANTWYSIIGTYDGSTFRMYINGVLASSGGSVSSFTNNGPLYIGKGQDGVTNGYITNVQIYNTVLSANDVQSLYNEGIGGAPTSIQYLAGWWPLNGDTNDYSGNGNNGVPTNVIFIGSWS